MAKTPRNPLYDVNPPATVEAEKALLGAILINPSVFPEIASFMKADDFYLLRHTHIWSALEWLASGTFVATNADDQATYEQYRGSIPIDIELLASALSARGQLEAIGGRAYIAELANSTPTSIHAEFYGQLVERAAVRRRLLRAADEIKGIAADESLDIEAVEVKAEQLVTAATSSRHRTAKASALEDTLSDQFDDIERIAETGELPATLIPSAFPDAEWTMEGFYAGSLYTYGGRPGMGKTTIMVAEAVSAAKYLQRMERNQRVRLYTLEMTRHEITDAIVSLETRIPFKAIRKRQMTSKQVELYVSSLKALSRLPLDIHDRMRTLEDIVADMRIESRDGGLALAFIDYVQILGTQRAFNYEGGKRAQVGYITSTLKNKAQIYNIAIAMGAQLRRGGHGEPTMELLKEAGNIEEDSDVVALIHRDRDAAKSLRPGEIQETTVIVDKNRNGAEGRFKIGFHAECKAFVSIAEAGYAPSAMADTPAPHWDR